MHDKAKILCKCRCCYASTLFHVPRIFLLHWRWKGRRIMPMSHPPTLSHRARRLTSEGFSGIGSYWTLIDYIRSSSRFYTRNCLTSSSYISKQFPIKWALAVHLLFCKGSVCFGFCLSKCQNRINETRKSHATSRDCMVPHLFSMCVYIYIYIMKRDVT